MNTIKQFSVFVMLCFLCCCSSNSQDKNGTTGAPKSSTEKKVDLKTALNAGDIKLTITGIENGMKLNLSVDKTSSKSLVLFIPKGTSNITFGSSQGQDIEITTQQEVKIDLSKTTYSTVVVDQSSKQRIFKGSVIIEKKDGNTVYEYQSIMIGVK